MSLQCSRPYLESVLPRPAAKSAAAALLSKCDSTERSDSSSDDEEGADLCNCEFSLAYGEESCAAGAMACLGTSMPVSQDGTSSRQTQKVSRVLMTFVADPDDMKACLHVGGKILLNKTRLHLKRGRRYGLCGHNGAGKVCPH